MDKKKLAVYRRACMFVSHVDSSEEKNYGAYHGIVVADFRGSIDLI